MGLYFDYFNKKFGGAELFLFEGFLIFRFDLFDQLQGQVVFSHIDLRSGYHRV